MIQASNMAILGFFSALSVAPFNLENVQATIRRKVPGKVLQKNLEVFQAGYDLAISSVSSGDGGLSQVGGAGAVLAEPLFHHVFVD